MPRIPAKPVVLKAGRQARTEIASYLGTFGAGWYQSLVQRAQEAGDLRLEAQLLQFGYDRTFGIRPADPARVDALAVRDRILAEIDAERPRALPAPAPTDAVILETESIPVDVQSERRLRDEKEHQLELESERHG